MQEIVIKRATGLGVLFFSADMPTREGTVRYHTIEGKDGEVPVEFYYGCKDVDYELKKQLLDDLNLELGANFVLTNNIDGLKLTASWRYYEQGGR